MMEIKAVFFDVDGTLVNTRDWTERLVNETFRDIGIGPVAPGYFTGLLKKGLGMRYHLAEVEKKPELYPKASEAFIRHYSEKIGSLKLFDGVEELLDALRKGGIRTGIFTSQHARMLKLTLGRFNLPVDLALSRDDVIKAKPAPDQIVLLCEKLSVEPTNALAVGDWTGDIEAGKAAGARTAGVLTGLCSREELEKKNPDYILENATEVRGIL